MDFMKVFDQTVREIQREVNLKILKVPEIEQKVLDATDNEPWGPHGTALAEIAQATKKFSECQLVMNVLWTRLAETGKDWRFVYKALAVIEYLISHGSERAVDEIVEHTFQISSLTSFEYVEPSGKDLGINVRKKAENIVSLLNDKGRIQEARNKAASNRDKYVGLSSSGITYKSGASSYSSGSYYSDDWHGSASNMKEGERYRDSYRKKDSYGEKTSDSDTYGKSHRGTSEKLWNASNESVRDSEKRVYSKSNDSLKASDRRNVVSSSDADDFDDFDPRGTSNSKPTAAEGTKQIDLFGQSLIDDLLDTPAEVAAKATALNANSSDVDLFADANFVSASGANTQAKIDLFASQHSVTPGASVADQIQVDLFPSQPGISPAVSSTADLEPVDLFASPPTISAAVSTTTVDLFASDSAIKPETKAQNSDPTNASVIDPFATVPLNNFDGSDFFGSFSGNSDVGVTEPTQSTVSADNLNNSSSKPSENSKPTQKKENFQVKSGIWADSLSRGLIDLNISAPKKVSLAEVGIVGLTEAEERDKGPPASLYMGRAMGERSGLGGTGLTSAQTAGLDDFFSSHHSQFGRYKK